MPKMIFHTPYPLDRDANAASGLRPVRMRDAFEANGYDVWEVTGTAKQRAAAANRVRSAIAQGIHFDFCYSESSTMPTSMTESHHLPLHPVMDFALMARLRRAGTPVGLFYRDIFWRYPEYGTALHPVKKQAALAAYRWDLLAYRRVLDVLFLPSMQMASHVGLDGVRTLPLPPGHDDPTPTAGPEHGAHLFYVGGLGGHYRFEVLLEAVQQLAAEGVDVSLTVCTLPEQWADAQQTYGHLAGGPVQVVHARAKELAQHYAKANMASLYIEPDEYWSFAAPVKLYEYQGHGKPILASEGSLAGRQVSEHQLGWTIPYSVEDAKNTLRRLANDPAEVARARGHVLAHREQETWRARAAGVAEALTKR